MLQHSWQKKGLIYDANAHKLPWAQHSALTPTPILLNPTTIRVYFAARDAEGISRIRFADLNADNPTEIIRVADHAALDIGRDGAFDDNGVILGDVVIHNNQHYLFYVGFQHVKKAKFLAFTGLAKSTNGGETFERVSDAPILDRSCEGIYIRAIHTALFEQGVWKIWYAAGNVWTDIEGTPFPNYIIHYLETKDLTQPLPAKGSQCVAFAGNEYRIGRPRVYHKDDTYYMYYTKGGTDKSYVPGLAVSADGRTWTRCDDKIGLSVSASGWDSQTLCYPSLLTVRDKTYAFYNGNAMGVDGFGYAELMGV